MGRSQIVPRAVQQPAIIPFRTAIVAFFDKVVFGFGIKPFAIPFDCKQHDFTCVSTNSNLLIPDQGLLHSSFPYLNRHNKKETQTHYVNNKACFEKEGIIIFNG